MRNLLDEPDDGDSYNQVFGCFRVVIPKISGSLSLIGSLIIMVEIVLDHRAKKGSVVSRVLFNLSLGDVFSSVAWVLSSWPMPSYAKNISPWNVGNEATCSAQGFILQMGSLSTPTFNLILAWCQYTVITKGTRERKLQILEKYFYGFVWGLTLMFSVVLLPFELYNAEYFVCTVASHPYYCTQSWMADEENPADCIRGDNALIVLGLMVGVLWIIILCVVVLLVRTIRAVEATERKSLRRSIAIAGKVPEQGPQRGLKGSFLRTEDPNLWRTKLMRQHAYRYIGVFIFTYFFLTLQIFIDFFSHRRVFTPIMTMCIAITLPLQGFLNFLVFSGKRQMRTTVGRILKKITSRIFKGCCCWDKPRPDQKKLQRKTGEKQMPPSDEIHLSSWTEKLRSDQSMKYPKVDSTEVKEDNGRSKDPMNQEEEEKQEER